ncbi:hypothetical protein WICPIJ_007406 [Wickerhamomyces pijperi]|uniref:DRBM domain-containing protein n=1 Tax=Wickerhamomyces pijperi TaxID=599730 RepID=A0A9P8TKG8_WICPI|nr:hypothetical protein WICPIJ_007406 [Wickerhamomyces pijperi]
MLPYVIDKDFKVEKDPRIRRNYTLRKINLMKHFDRNAIVTIASLEENERHITQGVKYVMDSAEMKGRITSFPSSSNTATTAITPSTSISSSSIPKPKIDLPNPSLLPSPTPSSARGLEDLKREIVLAIYPDSVFQNIHVAPIKKSDQAFIEKVKFHYVFEEFIPPLQVPGYYEPVYSTVVSHEGVICGIGACMGNMQMARKRAAYCAINYGGVFDLQDDKLGVNDWFFDLGYNRLKFLKEKILSGIQSQVVNKNLWNFSLQDKWTRAKKRQREFQNSRESVEASSKESPTTDKFYLRYTTISQLATIDDEHIYSHIQPSAVQNCESSLISMFGSQGQFLDLRDYNQTGKLIHTVVFIYMNSLVISVGSSSFDKRQARERCAVNAVLNSQFFTSNSIDHFRQYSMETNSFDQVVSFLCDTIKKKLKTKLYSKKDFKEFSVDFLRNTVMPLLAGSNHDTASPSPMTPHALPQPTSVSAAAPLANNSSTANISFSNNIGNSISPAPRSFERNYMYDGSKGYLDYTPELLQFHHLANATMHTKEIHEALYKLSDPSRYTYYPTANAVRSELKNKMSIQIEFIPFLIPFEYFNAQNRREIIVSACATYQGKILGIGAAKQIPEGQRLSERFASFNAIHCSFFFMHNKPQHEVITENQLSYDRVIHLLRDHEHFLQRRNINHGYKNYRVPNLTSVGVTPPKNVEDKLAVVFKGIFTMSTNGGGLNSHAPENNRTHNTASNRYSQHSYNSNKNSNQGKNFNHSFSSYNTNSTGSIGGGGTSLALRNAQAQQSLPLPTQSYNMQTPQQQSSRTFSSNSQSTIYSGSSNAQSSYPSSSSSSNSSSSGYNQYSSYQSPAYPQYNHQTQVPPAAAQPPGNTMDPKLLEFLNILAKK